MPPKGPVRVRLAPSPTGYFHIGTARTALFNWLFAKKYGGVFIVRIEDTDAERSEKKYEQDILEQMAWLGLNWDEGPIIGTQNYKGAYGPYRQSERVETYAQYIKKLLDTKQAYYCFCTKEELDAVREDMLTNGQPPKYNGHCRNLKPEEVQQKIASKKESVIRFKIPETKIGFIDLIRGKVEFDMALVGDIVIAKSIDEPLYNFAVTVDDYAMKISHVIRAEDHLANTPKQIAMQKALGFPEVYFAHLPLILNSDRSKMSKRFAATAVNEYRQAGYLPEALFNFLALMGWHPATDTTAGTKEKEIFTQAELIEKFSLERVQKGGAAFNQEKLDWLNSQFIKNLTNEELLARLKILVNLPDTLDRRQIFKVLNTVKERLKKLTDFTELADFFFQVPNYPASLLIWQKTNPEKISNNLKSALEILVKLPAKKFTKENLTEALTPLAEAEGRGAVLWPIRAALSGKDASPGPFEIMEILGKSESNARIKLAIEKLTMAGNLF